MQRHRTPRQVREDLKEIMLKSDAATSFAHLAKLCNLTYSQLSTTLSKFPNIKRSIADKLKNNRIQKEYRLAYVIDTSMIHISEKVINRVIDENNIIVCLKCTIEELDAIYKSGKDKNAKKAHTLMDKALYDTENFAIVDYRKSRRIKHDDVIIAYCEENRHRVVLMTADKNMALKAKAVGIVVQYYTPSFILPPSSKKLENGDVVIDTMYNRNQNVRLIKKSGKVYENITTPIRLTEGDQIYVATRVKSHIHFEHYEIIDDEGGNNLLFKRNVGFSRKEVRKLPKEYEVFVEEFKKRHDRKYVR